MPRTMRTAVRICGRLLNVFIVIIIDHNAVQSGRSNILCANILIVAQKANRCNPAGRIWIRCKVYISCSHRIPPSYMVSAAATAGTLSIGGSGRKDKGVRGMKLMYEPGDNLGWIRREPFERVMRLMTAWARAYHVARAEVTGKETFEEAEVTIEALACTLLPKKKCRVVMDYDPAGEKVYFYVVDEPEADSEQEDGSPK